MFTWLFIKGGARMKFNNISGHVAAVLVFIFLVLYYLIVRHLNASNEAIESFKERCIAIIEVFDRDVHDTILRLNNYMTVHCCERMYYDEITGYESSAVQVYFIPEYKLDEALDYLANGEYALDGNVTAKVNNVSNVDSVICNGENGYLVYIEFK